MPNAKTFTLQNFEERVSKVILQRGQEYYEGDAVEDLEDDDNKWAAAVKGSETYSVSVTLKKDEITAYYCNCPYDGAICKHVIAVLYEIRDELTRRIILPPKKSKKNQFDDLLLKVSVDEYRVFIKEYALKSKDFKMAFELFFAGKDGRIDTAKIYADQIKKLIKQYTGKGYMDYRSAQGFAKQISQLVDKGFDYANKRNFVESLAIAKVTLKEMIQIVTYCDDSSGALGDTLFNIIQLVRSIAISDDAIMDIKEHVFGFLQAQLTDAVYFDYGDFGYELMDTFQTLAEELNKHEEFLGFIDAWLPRLAKRSSSYQLEFFETTKIEFLEAIGRLEEAEALTAQNMEIVEVRQAEVNKAIDNKDFIRAKSLIADGIKIAGDKKHPGIVTQWEKQLLRIALLENDLLLTRKYYKQFAFDTWFSIDYYRQLKATYTADEWQSIIETIIKEVIITTTKKHGGSKWQSLNSYLLSALSPIYIEEKFTDRLFELVKQERDIDRIMQYHNDLVFSYAPELLQLYIPALELQGDEATDRSRYARLVGNMQKIIKAFPHQKEQVVAVAKRLKSKYPRRPAMLDELSAVLQ
ncbi:SWIM zinc finger family protein [Mucilaginibacter flavus]|uniref:SWIM zinc finger family protein n=1 Tax=Mucilaginibacter flavus TaxID=931504 RepID=UPI0025B412D4|nr:SWIM zinc finger family protein [Mucilaginibacter flavus]MDN3584010.1 SWIM zinc finger family protein [Mucilaginibacter flavus]